MATIPLPADFSEFLRLLNKNEVEYLLVGGYAVGHYGYVRATADIDIWIRRDQRNAERLVTVLREFGLGIGDLEPDVFLAEKQVIRMGVPPMRIEIQTSISGVEFDDCYSSRREKQWEGVPVPIIGLEKLRENKRAAGRLKDLNDLQYLDKATEP